MSELTTETSTETTNQTEETTGEVVAGECCGGECERPVARAVRPAVDAWTTETDVWLAADIPGAAAETVDLSIERDLLTIEATTRQPEGDLSHREYGAKVYRRSFRLSDQIDRGAIEARVADGVLRLRLPKAAEAKPVKIAVTTN